jgi:flagella basal body P-ring formation protein FlgA
MTLFIDKAARQPSARRQRGTLSRSIAVALGLGLAVHAGAVTPIHDHGEIIAEVEAAAMTAAEAEGFEDVEVRVQPLDKRLRPARCDQPLSIVRPHSGRALGPVSYGVHCSGSAPWTLYLRAEVSASVELPLLRRALPRGALIGEHDLQLTRRRVTTRPAGLIEDPSMAIGMELLRPLPAGSVLLFGQVGHPEIVERGQSVTLIAGSPGVEVRMQGKAMASGAAGDRLVVTNLSSGRRVEGVVLSDGSVRIR